MNANGQQILVTGINGFVGRALLEQLDQSSRFLVRGAGRTSGTGLLNDYHVVIVGPNTRWERIVAGVDTVIHCAARVHLMNDSVANPLVAFREINVEGTLALARQSVEAGVRRFIFISSIKVNGECTAPGERFQEDEVAPDDPYGISKWEAEQGLRALSKKTGMEVVIIRPPLVYGPCVKGNFLKLMKLARTGVPLPFGSIHNQRSMIYLGNLVDLIVKCIDHPAAANQTLLASDGQDLSTTDLLTALRINMGLSPRLLPVPQSLFHLLGRLTGKSAQVARLCGSLQVDNSKARILLDWLPPYTVEYGLKQTVNAFINGS